MGVELILGLVMAAFAQEEPDLTGLPIAEVSIQAPRGGLPDESLSALLRATQGLPYEPQLVRIDLTTLFRVGEFSSVEADLEPWVRYNEEGDPEAAVLLTYRVYPAPRVARVRVEGNEHFSARKMLDAAAVGTGEVFYRELDAPLVASRVEADLLGHGYVKARVTVAVEPLESDELDIRIRIDEGRPNVLRSMTFVGDVPEEVTERTLRRWARRAGLRPGKPVSQENIAKAQYAIRSRLARVNGTLFTPRRGWIGNRIAPNVSRDDSGAVDLTFAMEPGPRLDLVVTGLRWRPKKKARDALGIDERLRLTRGWIDEADDRLVAYLRREGFYRAEGTVEVSSPSTQVQTLNVHVDRGARHRLRGQPPRSSMHFEGNEHIPGRDLMRVADSASVDVIRLDYFTEDDAEIGLSAIENLYKSKGYQEAEAELDDVVIGKPGNAFTRPFIRIAAGLLGNPSPQRLTPTVRIVEGRITNQRGVGIAGAAQGVPISDLDQQARALGGEAFDPAALDRLSRAAVERHRDAGYLQVDARVRHDAVGPYEVDSVIQIDPGPLVLLRSVVTRGPRLTRPSFIRREVALERGAPLSASSLESARRQLYDLGIFRSVSTQLLGDERARDLLITVKERARWAAEAGGGLNTDQGARLFARLIRRNLFGLAHRIDAYGLIGVDYASDSVTNWTPDPGSIEWRAAVSYTAPHFPLREQDVVLDILLQERRQERTWRMARTGAGVTVDTHMGKYTSIQASLRVEQRNLQEVDSRAFLPGEAWEVLANDTEAASKWCYPCRMTESVRAVVLHDRRNDPVQPSRGFLFRGISELAPGVPWQKTSLRSRFLKSELRFSGYLPVGGPILRITAEAGYAAGITGSLVPLEDRFRLGGTGSLRGFSRQSVGPRNQARRVDVDWPSGFAPLVDLTARDDRDRWIPTGGDTSASTIVELLLPLPALGFPAWDGYAGALFADVGNVWLLGPGQATTTGLEGVPPIRVGVGAGIRIATPVGPLQLDLAANLQRIAATGARRALLVDAWEEPSLRGHLSLGTLW